MQTRETPLTTNSSHLEDVTTRLHDGYTEDALATVMDWAKNPGNEIASQLETLAVLYSDRSSNDRLDWQDSIIEFTRTTTTETDTPTEVYWVVDTYSTDLKDYHQREYAIDMFDSDGLRMRIEIDYQKTARVFTGMGDSKREVIDEEAVENVVFDTFCYLLIAYEKAQGHDRMVAESVLDEEDAPVIIGDIIPVDFGVRSLRRLHHLAMAA